MTEKLYDNNAYDKKFNAVVTGVERENELYRIELDKTLFFPLEGGQSPDKGTLNGIPVVNVTIEDDTIFHYTEEEIPVGTEVEGLIDFDHRFRNMQMHSGEHIFSGLCYKNYGYNNVGFHLSDSSATIDIDSKLSYEELLELEKLVNGAIYSNIDIKAWYPSGEELSKLEYRSKKELKGPVRIVSIENVDICACCAPHVKKTGEIGIFKITSFENYKGGVRINYLCGYRALEDYESRISKLREISRDTNAKAGLEEVKVKELLAENGDLKYKVLLLTNECIENSIKEELNGSENGLKIIEASESKNIKQVMNIMHKYYPGTSYVFCGSDSEGYRFLIESDKEDLTVLLKKFKDELSAKGGGKPDCIQGNLSAKIETIKKYLNL